MQWPESLRFASDATIYALWGGAFLLVSVLAALGDRRRARRRNADDVGIVPWRDISALTGFAGLALMAFAAVGWLRG